MARAIGDSTAVLVDSTVSHEGLGESPRTRRVAKESEKVVEDSAESYSLSIKRQLELEGAWKGPRRVDGLSRHAC